MARNRCTRTVDSLRPSARLTSRALCPAIWHNEKNGALSCGQLRNRCRNLTPALAGQQPIFGARLWRHQLAWRRLVRRHCRQDPAQAAGPRLPKIQTPVHEDAGEPDLERQLLAVAGDVREHLDEGVLYRFIGVMHVPQVVIRNTGRAPLLEGDKTREPFPSRVALSSDDKRLDLGRERGLLGQRRRRSGATGGNWRERALRSRSRHLIRLAGGPVYPHAYTILQVARRPASG